MAFWLLITVISTPLFFLSAAFPQKWASLVSAENAFFVNKGWISESLSQTFINIETSIGFQVALAVVSALGIYMLVQ